MNAAMPCACTAALALFGCATAAGVGEPLLVVPNGEPVQYILVDAVEDLALGGWNRYTLVYSGRDRGGQLVVAGRRKALRVSREAVAGLLEYIAKSDALAETGKWGQPCDDCPQWRVLIQINQKENAFVAGGSGVERPGVVRRLAALAGE